MKLYDLGEKQKEPKLVEEQESKSCVVYPTIRLEELPDLKGSAVGDKYVLTAKVRVKGVEEYDGKVTYTLEVLSAGAREEDKDSKREFLREIGKEAEKSKYSDDITRMVDKNSKAHKFNQQLS